MEKKKNLFSEMTVFEIKNYLKKKNSVIVPVGIIEQHGYHLPTFTDSYIAEGVAERIAKKLDILYTPVLYTSYSGGCLPGTINFNPSILVLCLRDMCTSLAQQGFKNIFIILGHGGSENLKVLEASLFVMIRENSIFDDVAVAFTPFWRYAETFMDGFYKGDGHGGDGETSMIMYLKPHLVKMEYLATDNPKVLEGMKKHPDYYQKHEKLYNAPNVLAKITQKDEVQVGVMGDFGFASAKKGRIMVEETVDNLSKFYRKLLAERKKKYFVVEPNLDKLVL